MHFRLEMRHAAVEELADQMIEPVLNMARVSADAALHNLGRHIIWVGLLELFDCVQDWMIQPL